MSNDIQVIKAELAMVMEENSRLKAKLIDLESRSHRNNTRLVGLPEGKEGLHQMFVSQLLLDVFGEDMLGKALELDRALWMLMAKLSHSEKPRAVTVFPQLSNQAAYYTQSLGDARQVKV